MARTETARTLQFPPTPDSAPVGAGSHHIRVLTIFVYVVLLVLILAACGSKSTLEDAAAALGQAENVVFEAADQRGSDPFVPDAEVTECQPEALIGFLDDNPTIAAAWAEAADVEVDEIAATIRSLEPTVLDQPTRVTNHAYRGGVARGFQATLATGTAVLIDDSGVPRVRCACGNPLAEPGPTAPIDQPTTTTKAPNTTPSTTSTIPGVATPGVRFCAVWANVAPTIMGGPTEPGLPGILEYLDRMVEGFNQLVTAAEATPGFPADALTDLQDYLDALVVAADSEVAPGPGDIALRERVEDFLSSYCDNIVIDTKDPVDPTHTTDPADPIDGTTGNCGSMQFWLLIEVANGLGIDHAAVSGPYLQAMDDVLASVDPGAGFDVADLSPMTAFEQVGCLGSQAMQQLISDSGYADVIADTELES